MVAELRASPLFHTGLLNKIMVATYFSRWLEKLNCLMGHSVG